jgi:hypothetical protein
MGLQSSGRVRGMITKILLVSGRAIVAIALCASMVGVAGRPAAARIFVGIGIPFFGPGFYGPPAYYPPPPMYYPPPPVVYAPPQSYAPGSGGAGQACYAGPYVCPMDRPATTGAGCYCPGNGGQKMWGHAS